VICELKERQIMTALKERLFLVIVTVFSCATFCCAEDIISDFEQAMQMLPKQPKQPASG